MKTIDQYPNVLEFLRVYISNWKSQVTKGKRITGRDMSYILTDALEQSGVLGKNVSNTRLVKAKGVIHAGFQALEEEEKYDRTQSKTVAGS